MAEYELSNGAIIQVRSIGRKDQLVETEGVFMGYTSMAGAPCLVLENDDGMVLLSVHMVVSVRVLEEGVRKEEKNTPEELYR